MYALIRFAVHGVVGQGLARHGGAGLGKARHGLYAMILRGGVRLGSARRGKVWQGVVRHGMGCSYRRRGQKMAHQVTRYIDDPTAVAFAVGVFADCGEPVAWTVETRRADGDGRKQYALVRHDCHVEHQRSENARLDILVED